MSEIGKIARITVQGADADRLLADTTVARAELVWTTITNELLRDPENPPLYHAHKGEDGYQWKGALASVVRFLFPQEAYQTDGGAKSTQQLINEYLRLTDNADCLNKSGKPPVWWIRKKWNGAQPVITVGETTAAPGARTAVVPTYAERTLTKDEAGETRPPAPVTVTFRTAAELTTLVDEAMQALDAATTADEVAAAEATAEAVFALMDEATGIDTDEEAPDVVVAPPTADEDENENENEDEDEATEATDNDPVTHRCRLGCSKSFTTARGRTVHEMNHPKRDAIITITRGLIASGEEFTLNSVAHLAGYSGTSTLKKYFSSVEELMAAVEESIQRLPYACTAPGCPERFKHPNVLPAHVRSHEQTTQILEQAGPIVAANPDVTLTEIAARLHLSTSSLYLRWSGRDAFIEAVQAHHDPKAVATAVDETTDVITTPIGDGDGDAHARHLVQLIVGFCHRIGMDVNRTSLHTMGVPVPVNRRDAFYAAMRGDQLIRLVPTLGNKNASGMNYVPGVAFDESVARQLDRLNHDPHAAPSGFTIEGAAQLILDQVSDLRDQASRATSAETVKASLLTEGNKLKAERDEANAAAQAARDEADSLRTKLATIKAAFGA